jgi:tripartite-type tricarboxylate transporter receptor subunit TctC
MSKRYDASSMIRLLQRVGVMSFVAILILLTWQNSAGAQAAKDYYRGKTINLIVGGTAGGGVDVSARIMARYLGKYLPGNPSVVAQLMPGAGGVRAIDYLNSKAPRDGTALALLPPGPLLEPMIGKRQASYRIADFNAIGAMTKELSLCASWHLSRFKTIAQAQDSQMIVAGTGAASTPDIYPIVLNELIGTKFKVITGFQGGQESILAIERGEVDGRCGWGWSSIKSTKPDWVNDKKLNYLLQFALEKSPEFKDVPLVMDLIHDASDKQLMRLLLAPLALNKPIFGPPGIPNERLAELRQAFVSAMNDAELRSEVTRLSSEEPDYTAGAAAQSLVSEMYATPESVVNKLRSILRR